MINLYSVDKRIEERGEGRGKPGGCAYALLINVSDMREQYSNTTAHKSRPARPEI